MSPVQLTIDNLEKDNILFYDFVWETLHLKRGITMIKGIAAFCMVLLCSVSVANSYIENKQSEDAPADPSQIITLPKFPAEGRKFEIRRTYRTTRSSRMHRATPPEGAIETLIVKDGQGKLEFQQDGRYIHTIYLGECFSFAKMDDNHDYKAQGSPSYVTAPPDCKVWNDRSWQQTYKSFVEGWHNPCVYEARRSAKVYRDGDRQVIHSGENVHLTIEKNGKTYDTSHAVVYDTKLQFFSMFNVGYVGKVEVLREIK